MLASSLSFQGIKSGEEPHEVATIESLSIWSSSNAPVLLVRKETLSERAFDRALTSTVLESEIPILLEKIRMKFLLLSRKTPPMPEGLGLPNEEPSMLNFKLLFGGGIQSRIAFILEGFWMLHPAAVFLRKLGHEIEKDGKADFCHPKSLSFTIRIISSKHFVEALKRMSFHHNQID